jgi:hypothetical protein
LRAEKIKVQALLAKPPEERTEKEWNIIAYSPFGTGVTQRC